MLTFYHSPQTRSTRVMALIHAMNVLDQLDVKTVTVPRQDSGGGPDATNPHPEKKVPALVHDGELIRETSAIMVYLTDHFKRSLGLDAKEEVFYHIHDLWFDGEGASKTVTVMFDEAAFKNALT